MNLHVYCIVCATFFRRQNNIHSKPTSTHVINGLANMHTVHVMYVYESTCTYMYTALYILFGLLSNDYLHSCLSTQDPVQIAIEQNGDRK